MAGYRKKKITVGVISSLDAGETVMDTDEPGFGVRCQRGAPTFFVRKFANGRRHFETIGEFGTGGLTVTTARDKASRMIAAIRDGISPAERRARDRAMPTVAELAENWLDVHVDAKLKSKTAKDYRSTLNIHVLPALGRLRTDRLDEMSVADMHQRGRDTPYAANRALAVVSKMMEFAERQGFRPKGSNPVTGIERFREEKRERFLSTKELIALGQALSSEEILDRHSPLSIAAIGFLLLTGMRLQEVLRLRHEEVDLQRAMLFLGDSKTGKKSIVLGLHAVELLSSLPSMAGSPWVFPSSVDPQKPMYDVKKTWTSISRVAGLEGVRIHDLRHSFASVAASSGGSLPMIGRLLGHSQAQTTQRYAHLAHDPVRQLADQASAVIAGAMAMAGQTNVESNQ
jgi:integrase